MKKQLLYSAAIATAFLAAAFGIIISNETGAESNDMGNKLTNSIESGMPTGSKRIDSKNETVYVMTDTKGATKNVFIGSTLYTGDEKLPFELVVRYYLDGTEVSATELVGKSGHVKIAYEYGSVATYQGVEVPFLAITGVNLDSARFGNVTVKNGKIISEGENYTIAGYSFLGLNGNFGMNLIPESFVVEADATDFALGTTYTVLTNDLIAEIDTSKLTDIDSLINSISQLESGLDQIISGATSLSDGMGEALEGAKKLQTGAEALGDGVGALNTGAAELSEGLELLVSHNEGLVDGATRIFANLVASANQTLNANATLTGAIMAYGEAYGLSVPINMTIDDYAETLDRLVAFVNAIHGDTTSLATLKMQLDGFNEFYLGLIGYTDGVSSAAVGAETLSEGLTTMVNKMPELTDGLGTLVNGMSELYGGSIILREGLTTFKTAGINKIVEFANNDLAGFIYNTRRTVAAARNYKSFDSANATSVKFIVKTASVK